MKTVIALALLFASQALISQASASVRPQVLNGVIDKLVEHPRVLPGTTNSKPLGSKQFVLDIIPSRERMILQADLVQNNPQQRIPYAQSSNPEAFHLNVSYRTKSAIPVAALRLNYHGASKPHRNPNGVTRTVSYDVPVTWTPANSRLAIQGRIVGILNQKADTERGVWKTVATFVRFESK